MCNHDRRIQWINLLTLRLAVTSQSDTTNLNLRTAPVPLTANIMAGTVMRLEPEV